MIIEFFVNVVMWLILATTLVGCAKNNAPRIPKKPQTKKKSHQEAKAPPSDGPPTQPATSHSTQPIQSQKKSKTRSKPKPYDMPLKLDGATFDQLVSEVETFIFDADGVLWLGDEAIPGSVDLIRYLSMKGKQLLVLTNNTTKSKEEIAGKMSRLGFTPYLSASRLVTPAIIAADYCSWNRVTEKGKKVYLIGEGGLQEEFRRLGMEPFGYGLDPDRMQIPTELNKPYLFDFNLQPQKEKVGAVVVGYDRHWDYVKMLKAANYLQDKECLFVATNLDETTPGPNCDLVIPDAGPMIEAVKKASGREPDVVCGKPSTTSFDFMLRKYSLKPKFTVMIGDRLNTDITFGRQHDLYTLHVYSGVHQSQDVEQACKKRDKLLVPNWVADDLGSLIPENYLCKAQNTLPVQGSSTSFDCSREEREKNNNF